MTDLIMKAQMVGGAGFIAALDQSGGSTPGALKAYGVPEAEFAGDDAKMFEAIHQMRVRIITAPSFTGKKVLAAILFEKTMDGQADGVPVPTALWKRGVVPFLKMDKGLEDEANGVQLMKPMPGLDDLLARAVKLGVFAEQIIGHGLMPIIEPEVSIKAADREAIEDMLRDEIAKGLDALSGDKQVMLKLSIPAKADTYAPLIGHLRVARVVALSGGFSRDEACAHLSHNHGMIASFSRALLEDLRHGQSDAEFDTVLGTAIDQIYTASVVKS
jgi:fructose-bisphosphate aldolase class I